MYSPLDGIPLHKLTPRSKLTFDLEDIIDLAIVTKDTYTLTKVYQHVHILLPKAALDLIDEEQHKFIQAVIESDLPKLSWYLDKVTLDFQFVDLSKGFLETVKKT